MTRLPAAVAASAALLLLTVTGCSAQPSGAKTPATSPASSSSPAAKASAAPAASNMGPNYQKIRADGTKSFGHYYLLTATASEAPDFSKDVMVQVDDMGSYHPTSSAYVNPKAKHYERYKVTVINNTARVQDLTAFSTSATDGDADATEVTDVPAVTGNAPSTPVRPGKTIHWFVAFGDDKGDQTVSVQPALRGADGSISAGSPCIWSK